MLVDHQGFAAYADKLKRLPPKTFVGIDLETTGLKVWAGARAFLVGLSTAELGEISYYLTEGSAFLLKEALSIPHIRWVAHKFPFEMSFLDVQCGLEFRGECWDSMVFARVEYNDHRSYKLEACAERAGLDSKYKPAMDWLEEHGPKYHEMPRELIVPYVELDAKICRQLAEHQLAVFKDWERNSPHPISAVIRLELETTKNLYAMTKAGIAIDEAYIEKASLNEFARIERTKNDFKERYGKDFVDSAKFLQPIFEAEGLRYGITEKGNPSFDVAALKLAGKDHPLIQMISAHRDALKRHGTYWLGLKEHSFHGELHPDIFQTGAATFRMSIKDPACQTWPDDSEDSTCQYPIRRALIARPGRHLVSIDYKTMELRKMADEAEDENVIAAIESGRDLHQELANDAHVPRAIAKNGRFARLYGGGYKRIASTLDISEADSKRLCDAMDRQSPGIAAYCNGLIRYAKSAPYGYNFLGRRYHFDRGFEYKYPNYRVQGGCGEILRAAIRDVGHLLQASSQGETKMVLPIHDELIFDFAPEDLGLTPEIKKLMIAAHTDKKRLGMDVSVAIGQNLHDLEDYHGKTT